MKKLAFGFTCVVAGCAVGAVVPRITAQTFPANPAAPKWQQYCEMPPYNGSRPDALVSGYNAALRERGEAGWEMVSFVGVRGEYMICYKRPAP